jgi:cyanophycin synthetase
MLNWWADEMEADTEDALRVHGAIEYINSNLSYPVYVKPHVGASGLNVWKCYSDAQVLEVLGQYERKRIKVALIEAAVSMPDYRIVVLDDMVISAYRRDPAQVVGDGVSTVEQLRNRLAKESAARDEAVHVERYIPQMNARLARIGIDNQHVLGPQEVVQLVDLSNLCAGGTAVDLTDRIDSRWATLAVGVATYFNLRLSGVDIACPDLTSDIGEYAVLEVNGSPGLDLYGAVGEPQEGIVRNLYAQVFNTMPANRTNGASGSSPAHRV